MFVSNGTFLEANLIKEETCRSDENWINQSYNYVFSGPLITANFTHTNATNLTTESDLFGPNYFYGLEVALVTMCFLIGITVNLLLGNDLTYYPQTKNLKIIIWTNKPYGMDILCTITT